MNEIEIKVKIDDKDHIIRELEKQGCKFSDEKHQIDTIFLDKSAKDFNIKPGMIVLRIRTIGDKHLITLKQRGVQSIESKEIEFGVSDSSLCKELIENLGYKEMVTVDKKRITTKYKGYNICIDEVKDLGCFIEIEIYDKNIPINEANQLLLNLVKELNLDITRRNLKGYSYLMYDKLNMK